MQPNNSFAGAFLLYGKNSERSSTHRSTLMNTTHDCRTYPRIERLISQDVAGSKMVMTNGVAALPEMVKSSTLLKSAGVR
jgi:hypothetical protein